MQQWRTPRRVAVVLNPASGMSRRHGAAGRRNAISTMLAAHEVRAIWYETSADRPADADVQLALAQGAELVLVCGGDGTIMACAQALAGTAVPIAVVPCGTGNIIAASLGIPNTVVDAIEVAMHGRLRRIDLGIADSGRLVFSAAIGFGAAVMRDASPHLKTRAGMVAYLVAAVRHLADPTATFRLNLDGKVMTIGHSDGVVIGNLAPMISRQRLRRATLDDGQLEVGVLRIRPWLDWLHAGHAFRQPRRPPFDWYQASRVEVDCDRLQPVERNGNWVGMSSRLAVGVMPRALVVRAPASSEPALSSRPLLHWLARDLREMFVLRRAAPAKFGSSCADESDRARRCR